MAVTKAREDLPAYPGSRSVYYDLTTGTGKVKDVNQGASGGLAPEGYGLANILGQGTALGGVENARVANEGVAQRGKEDDEKRFQEAEKFQKSKAEFDKKALQAQKALAEGKDENPLKEAILKQKEQQDEEAAKKPTAAGGQTQLDNPVVAQSAEATRKEEAADIATQESAVKQAEGNVKEAEEKKKEAETLKKEAAKGGK